MSEVWHSGDFLNLDKIMILWNVVKQYGEFIPGRRHHRLSECKRESKFYCFGSVLLWEPATNKVFKVSPWFITTFTYWSSLNSMQKRKSEFQEMYVAFPISLLGNRLLTGNLAVFDSSFVASVKNSIQKLKSWNIQVLSSYIWWLSVPSVTDSHTVISSVHRSAQLQYYH